MMLEPDRDQLEIFIEALFRHVGNEGYVSLRSFFEGGNTLFRSPPYPLASGLKTLFDFASYEAAQAARHEQPVVFCPPVAVFKTRDKADEQNLLQGPVISLECDAQPQAARRKAESLLGPATITVRSGGVWVNGAGEGENKLHLHWRLKEPAEGDDLAKLKAARRLLTQIVGGDPSNVPICHPLRWPGSWHRKGEPRLCAIESCNPDIEIDLTVALDNLIEHSPVPPAPEPGKSTDPEDWDKLIANIIAGRELHNSIARLAAKYVASGMSPGTAVNQLRALMQASATPHDTRWQSRFDDIPRAVATAEKFKAPVALVIKTSAEFIAGFVPPEYVVVGLLQRRFFYSLTAPTGHGKTAIMLMLAACAALGNPFAGKDTKQIRVLYLAAENADDVRMRWIALAQRMGFDPDKIEVYFIEGRFKLSNSLKLLRAEAEKRGGEFGLVIVDTGPVFFEGKEENENKQLGDHARLLRSLIDIVPGGPCVVAACHPIKHAGSEDLLPRGGGAYLAETDGNLTCWKTDSAVELHWQGKFRGPDFAPINFLIRTVTHQELKDSAGRLLPTVIAEHISEQATEEIAAQRSADETRVLELISHNPKASQANIATAMGWKLYSGEPHKTRASRTIAALIKDRLVKKTRDGFQLTRDGKKALNGNADAAEQNEQAA